MANLFSIEVNKSGLVLSISTPPNYLEHLIKVGSNVTSCWNQSINNKMEEFIESIFSNSSNPEISFNTTSESLHFTGFCHTADKAFLCLRSTKLQPVIEEWGFDELSLQEKLVESQPITFFSNLKRFTENLPLVIFEIFLNPDGRFEFGFINKEMETFFPEFNREAVNADNSLLFVRVHPDDKQKLMDSILNVFKLKVWDIEYRVVANGETRWVKGYGRPEPNDIGTQIKVCTYLQDITEKKKEAEKLSLVDFVFRNASMSIFLTKEDANFYDVNDHAYQALGYSKEELMGMSIHELDPNYSAEIWPSHWKELQANGTSYFETQHKRKDGSLIDVEINIRMIKYNNFELTCAFVTDITEKKKSQINLKLSEFTINNATWGIAYFKEDGSCINPNLAFAKLYAFTSLDELAGKKVFDFGNGYTPERWKQYWDEMKEVKNRRYIAKRTREDGTDVDLEINPVFIDFDNVELICAFVYDVSEKVKADKELKLSIERYEYASLATADVIWEWNIVEDCNYFSKNYTKIFGHKVNEVEYGNDNIWRRTVHPDDLDKVLEKEKQAINKEFEKWEHTYRIRKTNGEYSTVTDRGFAIQDESGTVVRLVGAIQDITEKIRVEKELERSVLRYQYATLATSDVIWEADFINKEVYISQNFTTFFGHPVSDGMIPMENNIWRQNMHPDEFEVVMKQQADALSADVQTNKWVGEYRLRKADGSYATVLDRTFAIKDNDGNLIGLYGAMTDITEKKKAEAEKEILLNELSRNNNELKQFSYITTHNLRAPLTNLVAICNLIKTDRIEDGLTIKLIEGFKLSTNLLHDTLNDLIKVLIIKENPNLLTEEVSFQEILNKVKDSVSIKLINDVASIDADFTNAPFVNFSTIYLESIFLNLITNSLKYHHPNRYPVIKIITSKQVNGSTKMVFSDNGIGMNMERVKNKIFGLYQRFHSNTDSKGIGLYLVYSQVTTLGGTIKVESEENVGTTFTIIFK